MVRWTVFFLILLRLAIGWHFLVEGWEKVRSVYLVGPTAGGKPVFSSAGYFRGAPGPLGRAVRRLEGDPDDQALARLVVPPLSSADDPATARPQDRIPPGLRQDWDDYLARFTAHFGLNTEQHEAAREKVRQAQAGVVNWLTYLPPDDPAARANNTRYAAMTTEQKRTFPTGEVLRRMSMAERVAEYSARVAELRDALDNKNWAFGKDVEGKRLGTLKADVARLRTGLLADLDRQSEQLRTDLERVLSDDQKARGPVPTPKAHPVIEYVDLVTPWMLCAIGLGLMLGLFSRLWALAGAVFLLMTCLAVPSLPWLPAPPQAEGNYLVVNKNVIEMLALWVLACAPTGRWFGLDAVLDAAWRAVRGERPAVKRAEAARA